ncbi:hypothetical protein NQZ68_018288 [Dissostichus eleginoides]|nr:hypothetical protein NQZ68_018288 [Dissostichus eleginoides]
MKEPGNEELRRQGEQKRKQDGVKLNSLTGGNAGRNEMELEREKAGGKGKQTIKWETSSERPMPGMENNRHYCELRVPWAPVLLPPLCLICCCLGRLVSSWQVKRETTGQVLYELKRNPNDSSAADQEKHKHTQDFLRKEFLLQSTV